jgi:hypothetical protein
LRLDRNSEKVEEGGEGLRLGAQRKSPRVMRKIINNDQIIFITRHAEYRRCPHVTVNQIKNMRSMRRRKRKQKHEDLTGTHDRGAQQEP